MKALLKIANCGPAHMPRTDGEGNSLKDSNPKPMVRGPFSDGSDRTMLKDKLKRDSAPGGSNRTMLSGDMKRTSAPGGSNREMPAGDPKRKPFTPEKRLMDQKKMNRGGVGAGAKGVQMKTQKWDMDKQVKENMFTKKAELEESMLSFDEEAGTVLRAVQGEI